MMMGNSTSKPIWEQLFPMGELKGISVPFSKKLYEIEKPYFHRDFPDTFEYRFFFLKALKGFLESQSEHLQLSLTLNPEKIDFSINAEAAKVISISEADWLRMDLVARLAGRVLEDINSIHKKVTIVPDDIHDPEQKSGIDDKPWLLFVSADFSKAIWNNVCGYVQLDKGKWIVSKYHEETAKYYKFDNDIDKKKKLETFGWRHTDLSDFDDNPISNKTSGQLASFLCFPAFFQHEESSLIFLCTPNNCTLDDFSNFYSQYSEDDWNLKHFNDVAVQNYVNYKQQYASQNKSKAGYQGSLHICLGVARHNSIQFEFEKAKELFGVFFQVDIYSNKAIDLNEIYELQLAHRTRLKYKILQLLAAESITQLETKNQELQKKDQMLSLLMAPLDSLSTALLQTQQDTQELRSILYSPARSLFAAAPNVWKYFEGGQKIKVGKLSIETCHNEPVTNDIAKRLLAGIILEILGKRTFVNPSNWNELFDIVDHDLNENNKATKELRKLCKQLLGMSDKTTFRTLVGLNREPFLAFKELLNEPYKNFSGEYSLYAFDILAKGIKLNDHTWEKNLKTFNFHLPCPQFSHFLELIGGIIEYAKNNGSDTSIAIKSEGKNIITGVSLEFSRDKGKTIGIPLDQTKNIDGFKNDLTKIFNNMKMILKEGLRIDTSRVAGDLSKPFLDFAFVCRSNKKLLVNLLNDEIGIQIISENSTKNMEISLEVKFETDLTFNKLHCNWKK